MSKEEDIFNACANGTYKYALVNSQKLIKKYPKSVYHQLIYHYVLLQMGKPDTKSCLEIMNNLPNDIKSIQLLYDIFNQLHMQEALQVYEIAAKKYPSFDLLTKWFQLGVETANYKVLQKSSMALKGFNNSRLFNSWAAFTCYLVTSKDISPFEKQLFPKLGLKIIESLKPLKNEQEVYLYVKLLQLNNQHEQIVKEIVSSADKLDLELQIILLNTLDHLQDWEQLYQWCKTILLTYKIDDFNTWKYLIKSSYHLKVDIDDIIVNYKTRNSMLAAIELQLQSGKDMHESVYQYLISFGTKNTAFYDIKHYFTHLDPKLINWLESQEIPKGAKGLIWEVNCIKFRLLFDTSLLSNPSFTKDMVTKYNFYKPLLSSKSPTDFSISSELILLIIQSLLTQSCTNSTIFTCLCILESAILKDQHEFHLRLWAIQLYTLLNCHQQAVYHWDSLKIKNVQFDVLNQFLSSRLATINPNVPLLEKGFDIYNQVESVYYCKIGFNKGVFNKLESMLEFQTRLSNSYLKKHLALQGVKIGRLINDKTLISDYQQDAFVTEEYDNRDLKIFYNFGIDEPLTNVLETIPHKDYNKVMTIQEKLIIGEDAQDVDTSILTEVEQWSFNTISLVRKLINASIDPSVVITHYDQVPKLPQTCSWKVSHTFLTIMDTCKAVHSMLNKQHAIVKECNIKLLNSLKEELSSTKESVLSSINSFKKDATDSQVLQHLQSNVVDRVAEIVCNGNKDSFRLMSQL